MTQSTNTQDTPRNGPWGAGVSGTPYAAPDKRLINVVSNMGILFSDDFGGSALNATVAKWDIFDGGFPAATLSDGTAQGAIGSGTAMGTGGNVPANTAFSVSSSALAITMGTTNGAEMLLLSKQIFSGSEDLTVVLSKSASLAANDIFVGLVEVDPGTGNVNGAAFVGCPLLNPNLANDFTNRGGVQVGKSASATAFNCEAVADQSGAVASGTAGTAPQTFATGNEVQVEFHAEDIIASATITDGVGGKANTIARVATQCPNDGKCYKLAIRLRNVSGPGGSTVVTFQRILVVDGQELRVEIASGRGDQNLQKAVAVNLASANSGVSIVPGAGENHIGLVGGVEVHLTNSPTVTAGAYTTGQVVGGLISLTGAVRVNGGSGIIMTAIVTVKTALTAPFDVYFFDTNPTNSTFTDNASLAVNVADLPSLIGVAHCTDLNSLGTPQALVATGLALPFKNGSSNTTLYAVIVIRGGETFASSSAIQLTVAVSQD